MYVYKFQVTYDLCVYDLYRRKMKLAQRNTKVRVPERMTRNLNSLLGPDNSS